MTPALERASIVLELPVQSIWSALANKRVDGEQPRRILFSSPHHKDGTTLLTACTALALCRNTRSRVALVEANPYSPTLAAYAECDPTPGFAEVLREEIAGNEALSPSYQPGLDLLPAGRVSPTEPVDWQGPNVHRLLAQEFENYAFTFIDAPPLLDRPASRLLFEYADLVVLVVRAGLTTKSDALMTHQILKDTGVPVAGMVVNRFKKTLPFL